MNNAIPAGQRFAERMIARIGYKFANDNPD